MIQILISFGVLHLFVMSGWMAKYLFKVQIQERSFVLISIYFLQPLLIFWGILLRPLDWTIVLVPSLYLLALIISTFLVIPLRYTTSDKKDKAILQITGLVSNTGNLGIPLGLFLFGPASVPYTAMINLINAGFVLTIGTYHYSRGQFPIKKSIINVIKLPIVWSACIAITWQLMSWPFPQFLMQPLEMAAYTTMVLQLMIFGMFIATIKRQELQFKNIMLVQLIKYALFPLVVLSLAKQFELPDLAFQCLFLQSVMPIAVNNMNLSALYEVTLKKWPCMLLFQQLSHLFLFLFSYKKTTTLNNLISI